MKLVLVSHVRKNQIPLIGFAGPRVIKQTIKRDLPEGFQTSEYLLEHGFLDFIVHRKDLKAKLGDLLSYFDTKKSDNTIVE